MTSSTNGSWRLGGGLAQSTDSAAFDSVVINDLTIKDSIQGDLNIQGTLTVDRVITTSTESEFANSISVLENIVAGGTVKADSAAISGNVAVLNDLLLQNKLVLGKTVSIDAGSLVAQSSSTQFLWSDGTNGVAINADFSAAAELEEDTPPGIAPNTVPASLYVTGDNPRALVAATKADHTRNILAQTSRKA